ncbi:MAG: AAA family ATPase [Cellvibrionaceae bacterium]
MYLEHYGFEVEPFEIAPNSEFLYLSKGHKKAFTFLNYALWNKDVFTLLTGEIGAGKTILLQHLLKTMPSAAEVVTIYQTQISPYELLYTIAEKFGLADGEDIPKSKLYQLVNNYIVESTRTIVIVVDEAQSLSFETLEELRMLAGIDIYSGKSNMNIILCGQPELKNIIESGSLEQLNQRIKLRFHLTRLDFEETKEYVQFRVYKAGQKLEIFTLDAIKQIYEFTQGLPRLINILADTALTCGYADGFYAISSRQIDDAVKELNWDSNTLPRSVNEPPRSMKGLHKVVNINSKTDGNMSSEDAGNLLTVAQDIAHQLERIADSLSNGLEKASNGDGPARKK